MFTIQDTDAIPQTSVNALQLLFSTSWTLLLTWINFNPSMDK